MNNHLIDKTLSFASVNDVSSMFGVTPEAIKKHVRVLFPEIIKNGHATLLTEYQVNEIKKKMIPTTQVVATSTDIEMAEKTMEVLSWLKCKYEESQKKIETLQIELDESKQWYSVKRVKNLGYLQDVTARKAWSPLKKWSIENDYQIISIFDANYGEVKTYHSEAWKAVYGVEFERKEIGCYIGHG